MGKLVIIEAQIKELSRKGLKQLREWLAKFDGEFWDRQFETDVKAGKLYDLAENALRDHRAGRSTKL